jgi:hypothetical protein
MSRLNKTILILAGLAFCQTGCDVLLPSEWGSSGWPCADDGDCASGNRCEMNYSEDTMCVPKNKPECDDDFDCFNDLDIYSAYCASGTCKAWDEATGFGDECGVNGDCDDSLGLDQCVCFWDSTDCFCTHVCDGDDNCQYPGDTRCMKTGAVATTPQACGRATFTEGNGIFCPNGNSDCEAIDSECGNFPFQDTDICGTKCNSREDCPHSTTQECGPLGGVMICGHPDWFGWYVDCYDGGDTVCDVTDSKYKICREGRCTRSCDGPEDELCPSNGRCHNDGLCILK